MSFYRSLILMEQTHPVLCRRRRELRGTCTLSRRSDEGTKATQLAEEKLGSECFDMGTWRWVLLKNMCDPRVGGRRSIAKGANTIGGGRDPAMC
ncbi:hypothetical protein BHE74_00050413 [Ensete ventricosum]|nr:hypothetical protein BHE74_00050413 [Ensete ventricosum]